MKITEQQIEVFTYLNELRESGVVNMFGAASYIRDEFGTERIESRMLLTSWMSNFNDNGYDNETILK